MRIRDRIFLLMKPNLVKKHIGTHNKGLLTVPYFLFPVNGIFQVILTKPSQLVQNCSILINKLIRELFPGIIPVIQLLELKCNAFQMVMLQESFRMIYHMPTIIYSKIIGKFQFQQRVYNYLENLESKNIRKRMTLRLPFNLG